MSNKDCHGSFEWVPENYGNVCYHQLKWSYEIFKEKH